MFGNSFLKRNAFTVMAFAILSVSAHAAPDENLCQVSSSRDVAHQELRQCEARLKEAMGPLRQRVSQENQQFGQIAAARTTAARSGRGGDCGDVVKSVTASNTSGVQTMDAAIRRLNQLRAEILERKEYFERQRGMLIGKPERFGQIFRGNAQEWSAWYFQNCNHQFSECENNAVTSRIRQIFPALAGASKENWGQRRATVDQAIQQMAKEHEQGISLLTTYLTQVDAAIKSGQQSQAALQKLSVDVNQGLKVSCQSLGEVGAEGGGTLDGGRASAFAQKPLTGTGITKHYGVSEGGSPELPKEDAVVKPGDFIAAGEPNPLESHLRPSQSAEPAKPALSPSGSVYTDESGAKYFTTTQTTADGRTIGWLVKDQGGQISVSAMDASMVGPIGSDPAKLKEWAGMASAESWTAYAGNKEAMQPGQSGVYIPETAHAEANRQALMNAGEVRRQTANPEGITGPTTQSVTPGTTPVVASANGEIVSADGSKITVDDVAAMIERDMRAQGRYCLGKWIAPGQCSGAVTSDINQVLSADDRQKVAAEVVKMAQERGGSYEEQVKFISDRLARSYEESRFNPRAVSSADAFGMNQFLPATAEAIGRSPAGAPVLERYQMTGTQCAANAACSMALSHAYDVTISSQIGRNSANNDFERNIYYICGAGGGPTGCANAARDAGEALNRGDLAAAKAHLSRLTPTVQDYVYKNQGTSNRYFVGFGVRPGANQNNRPTLGGWGNA